MKNKSLITNISLALLSVLVIAFLALPYVTPLSGYDCFEGLQFLGDVPADIALIYIAPLFILLAAVVTLIFSVLGLLGDLNVVKSAKLLKAARVINLVAAIILAVFVLLGFILAFVVGAEPGVGLILNLVFALVILAGTVLNRVWNRK